MGMPIVNFIEGNDGGEDVLEWAGEAVAHIQLIEV